MRIQPEECIALGVDFQERLLPVIHDGEELIKKAGILFSGLDVLGVPVVISRQYPKGLGDTVPGIKEVAAKAVVLDKTAFSCWQDEGIRQALRQADRKTVILAGVEAHICVLQSAVDLLEAGFRVVYVSDCVGSRKQYDKKMALRRAFHEGAVPATCESLLFELTGGASSPVFKRISALVK